MKVKFEIFYVYKHTYTNTRTVLTLNIVQNMRASRMEVRPRKMLSGKINV